MSTESYYVQVMNAGTYDRAIYHGNLEACAQQGQAAADQCYLRSANPYGKWTAEHQWWDAGWLKSLDEISPST